MTIEELYTEAAACTYNDSPKFNIHRAIEYYSEVIRINPDFKSALEERSRCYFRLGMHQQRLDDLVALAKRNPHVRLLRDIAECLVELNRMQDAFDVICNLDLDPQQMSSSGLRLREKICRALGKHDLADKDQAAADAYDAEQMRLWDDPNYYGHYM